MGGWLVQEEVACETSQHNRSEKGGEGSCPQPAPTRTLLPVRRAQESLHQAVHQQRSILATITSTLRVPIVSTRPGTDFSAITRPHADGATNTRPSETYAVILVVGAGAGTRATTSTPPPEAGWTTSVPPRFSARSRILPRPIPGVYPSLSPTPLSVTHTCTASGENSMRTRAALACAWRTTLFNAS